MRKTSVRDAYGEVVCPISTSTYLPARDRRFLMMTIRRGKQKVAQVDPELALSAALNLIEATSMTTETIPAPSGIGAARAQCSLEVRLSF